VKIAWFSPFSRRSAIGQYSSIIVQELARYADVTVFAAELTGPSEAWLPNFNLYYLKTTPIALVLRKLQEYDVLVYNLGNNTEFHARIYDVFQQRPGVVILHDVVMMHFFAGYYWQHRQNIPGFVREMTFSHGDKGAELAQKVVDQDLPSDFWSSPVLLEYNLVKSTLNGAYGVVVHSEFARKTIEPISTAPMTKIDFPTPNVAQYNSSAAAAESGGRIRLLSHGHVIPNKMIAEVIEVIGQSQILRDRVVYHVIGAPHKDYLPRLEQLIEQYQLHETVRLLGYQPDEILYDYMKQADILITLRNPHMGESSWVLLEATTIGKPTVVWKHGYYDEFPDDTVAKVDSTARLASVLETLCLDDTARSTLGIHAQQYAAQTFDTQQYCRRLLDFLQTCRYNNLVLSLADSVSDFLLELGTGYFGSENLVDRMGTEIGMLFPTSCR